MTKTARKVEKIQATSSGPLHSVEQCQFLTSGVFYFIFSKVEGSACDGRYMPRCFFSTTSLLAHHTPHKPSSLSFSHPLPLHLFACRSSSSPGDFISTSDGVASFLRSSISTSLSSPPSSFESDSSRDLFFLLSSFS